MTTKQTQLVIPKKEAPLGRMLEQLLYAKSMTHVPNRQSHQEAFNQDFQSFYKPTDDMWQAPTGTMSNTNDLYELNFLCQRRLGICHKATAGVAKDAIFNWFDSKKIDTKNTLVKIPGLREWQKKVDFKNKWIELETHRRMYGLGFLVRFWKKNEDMSKPAPNLPVRHYQVIDPLYLAPLNTYETRYLDYDPDIWNFVGGNLRVKQIHKSRIRVLRGPHITGDYRGLSVIEPIKLSVLCYFNYLINLMKGVAKWGNTVVTMHTSSGMPTPTEATEWLQLVDQYRANAAFILGRDDKVDFANTNIGTGLYEIAELLKEDMASGLSIPLTVLLERTESGGIGGEGAKTAESRYLSTLSNIQENDTDDLIDEFNFNKFDMSGLDLHWNLALRRTTEQEHLEKSMDLQNQILEENLKLMKDQGKMQGMQMEMFEEYKDKWTPEQELEASEQIKDDFVQRSMAFSDFMRLQKMLSPPKSKPTYTQIVDGRKVV